MRCEAPDGELQALEGALWRGRVFCFCVDEELVQAAALWTAGSPLDGLAPLWALSWLHECLPVPLLAFCSCMWRADLPDYLHASTPGICDLIPVNVLTKLCNTRAWSQQGAAQARRVQASIRGTPLTDMTLIW